MNYHPSITSVPDEILLRIFLHIPGNYSTAYLPIGAVSHTFRRCWRRKDGVGGTHRADTADARVRPPATRTVSILYPFPWNAPRRIPTDAALLNVPLLAHFVSWGYRPSGALVRACALRGDVGGMRHLLASHPASVAGETAATATAEKGTPGVNIGDVWRTEIVTLAGSAGRLAMLKFLVEMGWPWDPGEVVGEARENNHDEVVDYVLRNADRGRKRWDYERSMPYGEGMPSSR